MLELSPEELGDVILEMVHGGISTDPARFSASSNILYFVASLDTQAWPSSSRTRIEKAVYEAMQSLENAGLIMADPTQGSATTWRTLTRRGEQLKTRQEAADYRKSKIPPEGLVHPQIWVEVRNPFMLGNYDAAVFSAFKAVEVAVRNAGRFPAGELGVPLMRKAFAVGFGPLTDATLQAGEQEAQQHLFAGAIGAAKNPASHRNVEMDSAEAARLILFASYLLSIVDSRAI